jgi:hypothetical protein
MNLYLKDRMHLRNQRSWLLSLLLTPFASATTLVVISARMSGMMG